MKNKVYSLRFRMFLLIFILLFCQAVLVGVAVVESRSLLGSLQNVSEVQLPATKYLTYSDMMHDGLRAVVLEALYSDLKNQRELLPDIEKEAKEKSANFVEYIEKLEGLRLSEETLKHLNSVKSTVKDYAAASIAVIDLLKQGNTIAAVEKKKQFDELFEKLEESLEDISGRIESEASATGDAGKDIVVKVALFSLIGFAVSLFSGVFILVWTKKSFDALLKKVADVSVSVTRLSSVLKDESGKVKESTVEQSAAIQESAAAMEEMRSMIAQSGNSVKLSLETSQGALHKAEEGKQIMDRMSASMTSIQNANAQLQEISTVIANIKDKTTIINDIVFKTQLLSFNASIEAARAGEHGRGFAVVAQEVGNLALNSGKAAKDIENLLGDSQQKVTDTLELIQSRVSDGNSVSHEAHAAFVDIAGNIENIDRQVRSITEATTQQELGVQQTQTAMGQMERSSQTNAAASAQALDQAECLDVESQNLRTVMTELAALISGEGETGFVQVRPESATPAPKRLTSRQPERVSVKRAA